MQNKLDLTDYGQRIDTEEANELNFNNSKSFYSEFLQSFQQANKFFKVT